MHVPLRAKIGLTLFAAVAAILFVDDSVRRRSFQGVFSDVERSRAKAMVAQARGELNDLSHDLSLAARGHRSHLSREERGRPLGMLGVSLALSTDGEVLDLVVLDPDSGSSIGVRELPGEKFAASHPILSLWRQGQRIQGLFETERGFLVLGSAEVAVTQKEGEEPQPQLVILGAWVTQDLLDGLSESEKGAMGVVPMYASLPGAVGASAIPSEGVPEAALSQLVEGGVAVIAEGGEWGVAFGALEGLRQLPTAAVRVRLAEPLWIRLERFERLTSVAVAVFFPLCLLLLLQWLITGPLGRLTAFAKEFADSEDSGRRLGLKRRDEIGQLGESFDLMLDKLERSRAVQANAARSVGRSEMAVGVMHNVGNIVNSIQVSASLALDGTSGLPIGDLRRILDALKSNEGNLDQYLAKDPRGIHLLDYFAALLPQLETAAATASSESESVLMRVGKIDQLLHSLRGEEPSGGITQRLSLDDEIRRAANDVFGALGEDAELEVDTSLSGGAPLIADLQRVREVLLAIFGNARDAALRGEPGRRRVAIISSRLPNGAARVLVGDSGAGVPDDVRDSIFEMSFTTKSGGSGLGLHLAALSASELGGAVQLLDSGLGEAYGGAAFAFEFPGDPKLSGVEPQ